MLNEARNWPHVVRGKGEMIMGAWDQNFPVVVPEVEEFELFQHLPPKTVSSPLQTHPFAWGGCLLEGATGERGLVGQPVCRLCLVCVHGSRWAITPPTKEYSSSTHISR